MAKGGGRATLVDAAGFPLKPGNMEIYGWALPMAPELCSVEGPTDSPG